MSTFTLIVLLIAALFLGWAVWFVIAMIRYIASGQYDVDKRLRDICR
ncbi:MAG: hypothetical protein HZC39_13435 [Chloroflexi bacterium]|nr:hypothetical protein [Chloroflexota bacterium]MBI5704530.1 hypothetical protein [Chloroflexota bacterium]GER78886.1 hypothetical protein DIM_09670 [Candidatus Denitrolinea symbiosum]